MSRFRKYHGYVHYQSNADYSTHETVMQINTNLAYNDVHKNNFVVYISNKLFEDLNINLHENNLK